MGTSVSASENHRSSEVVTPCLAEDESWTPRQGNLQTVLSPRRSFQSSMLPRWPSLADSRRSAAPRSLGEDVSHSDGTLVPSMVAESHDLDNATSTISTYSSFDIFEYSRLSSSGSSLPRWSFDPGEVHRRSLHRYQTLASRFSRILTPSVVDSDSTIMKNDGESELHDANALNSEESSNLCLFAFALKLAPHTLRSALRHTRRLLFVDSLDRRLRIEEEIAYLRRELHISLNLIPLFIPFCVVSRLSPYRFLVTARDFSSLHPRAYDALIHRQQEAILTPKGPEALNRSTTSEQSLPSAFFSVASVWGLPLDRSTDSSTQVDLSGSHKTGHFSWKSDLSPGLENLLQFSVHYEEILVHSGIERGSEGSSDACSLARFSIIQFQKLCSSSPTLQERSSVLVS